MHGIAGRTGTPCDRLINLLDQLSGERDSDGNPIGVIHACDGALNNPAEMEREPIRRFRRSYGAADRVEVVAQRTELRCDRFRNEDFVQAARAIGHERPILAIATSRMTLAGSPSCISRECRPGGVGSVPRDRFCSIRSDSRQRSPQSRPLAKRSNST